MQSYLDNEYRIVSLPESSVPVKQIRAKTIIFSDQKSKELLNKIETIAPSNASVIVYGESGTGKELIAREIHLKSERKNRTFLAVNCGALVENLAESELFGYEAGAFTGATKSKPGLFETANGGTLFLDEVGELPLSLQVKLLRVIQEHEVMRVGGRKPIPIDIRIISGTHVDLKRAVSENKFRLDLYYRLNVININILPIRERKGDILPLVDYFINSYSKKLITPKKLITDRARNALLNYSWPGNIRELIHVLKLSTAFKEGTCLEQLCLPESQISSPTLTEDSILLQANLETVTKRLILQVLQEEKGNIARTAKRLNISRTTVYKYLDS